MTFADELYDALSPGQTADDDGSLLTFVNALGTLMEDKWEVAQSNWSNVFDADVCPPMALAYLAQFVGVALPDGISDDAARAMIKEHNGFNRGTPAAIQAALAATLTGSKSILFRERFGGAYKLFIRTITSETPDSAASLKAILSQKPAGITLDYAAISAPDYNTTLANYPTYTGATAGRPTYTDRTTNL